MSLSSTAATVRSTTKENRRRAKARVLALADQMDFHDTDTTLRILCRMVPVAKSDVSQLWWLIGSPFFPSATIISVFKCIHTLSSNHSSPDVDFSKEADDLRLLLPKGFKVIGALVAKSDSDLKTTATEAINAAVRLRKLLHYDTNEGLSADEDLVVAAANSNSGGDNNYFVSRNGSPETLSSVGSIIYEDQPEKFIWQRGCILHCQLPIRLPVYYPAKNLKEVENAYTHAADAVAHKFMDSQVVYVLEGQKGVSSGGRQPTIISGSDLNPRREGSNKTDGESIENSLSCSYICSKAEDMTNFISLEKNADIIQVSIFSNHSRSLVKPTAPIAEYYPAADDSKMLVVEHELDVLCYAAKDMPLTSSIAKLIVPALVDQLHAMRTKILANLLRRHPQLRTYHFIPPGMLHPITVTYDLKYGETEMEQDAVRRSIHLRLGLPLDRPLLRIANAIHFTGNDGTRKFIAEKGLLKDVHLGIPSSGVSGGTVSLIQGSYEYYHYLLDGFDDSGWGCAYRSLQTIISWFRLQHYTGIDVPSHREIQQSLVEMGDKDPSFIGSREWIGAIELSFVLDKLLGVSCKVINVRSGSELPEKCRELALHFETQGTPVMIGGGVLAYTLLGVDYNEASGDCAFLILDPHYTGNDDLKKIVNGGWCGWKKAVDSKGKHFFLHDKFYNLLLPQRPFMV